MSKFAELCPKHDLLSSKLPHNVCLCRYHKNFIYAINALHDTSPEFPADSYNLPQQLLCQEPTQECWLNQCSKCKDGTGFRSHFKYETAGASWYVWKQGDDSRHIKSIEEGTTDELADYICNMLPQISHCHMKWKQTASYNGECNKAASQTNGQEVVIQIDFSENYTCMCSPR